MQTILQGVALALLAALPAGSARAAASEDIVFTEVLDVRDFHGVSYLDFVRMDDDGNLAVRADRGVFAIPEGALAQHLGRRSSAWTLGLEAGNLVWLTTEGEIFRWRNGVTDAVAGDATPFPGTPCTLRADILWMLVIDGESLAFWGSPHADPRRTDAENCTRLPGALFFWQDGRLEPLPGGLRERPALDQDWLAYNAALADGTRVVRLRDPSGTLTEIVREGASLPDRNAVFESIGVAGLSGGRLGLWGQDESFVQGAYAWERGRLSTIVEEGMVLPGGRVFDRASARDWWFFDGGFALALECCGEDTGFYVSEGRSIRAIAETGMKLPRGGRLRAIQNYRVDARRAAVLGGDSKGRTLLYLAVPEHDWRKVIRLDGIVGDPSLELTAISSDELALLVNGHSPFSGSSLYAVRADGSLLKVLEQGDVLDGRVVSHIGSVDLRKGRLALTVGFGGWADHVYVAELPPRRVAIDVRPGESGRVHPLRRATLSVWLSGSPALDASRVDVSSVGLGPRSAPAVGQVERRDANRDGWEDLLLRFRTRETGIEPGARKVCLSGRTHDGIAFAGCDGIPTIRNAVSPQRR